MLFVYVLFIGWCVLVVIGGLVWLFDREWGAGSAGQYGLRTIPYKTHNDKFIIIIRIKKSWNFTILAIFYIEICLKS